MGKAEEIALVLDILLKVSGLWLVIDLRSAEKSRVNNYLLTAVSFNLFA